jgi:hypothetical protein
MNSPHPQFNGKLTVVVTSCDKYADLWQPFSILFKRYWGDCPFEVVLVTESPLADCENPAFDRVAACGKGVGWGDRLVMALDQIRTPRVIMLCDDYFLCDRVDMEKIGRVLELAEKYNAGYFPMIRMPISTRHPFSESEGLFELKKGTAYCIATQAGVWDVGFLRTLAKGVNSIWEFERHGSFKCAGMEQPIIGMDTMSFPFEDAVHKGRWEDQGVRLCDRNDITIDFTKRKRMTEFLIAKEHFKGAILQLNPTLVVRIQNLLNLGHK